MNIGIYLTGLYRFTKVLFWVLLLSVLLNLHLLNKWFKNGSETIVFFFVEETQP